MYSSRVGWTIFKFWWSSFYIIAELYSIFAITAQEEGILGPSNWTDVWYSTGELDVLDYYEDFEVSRMLLIEHDIWR